MLWVMWNVVKSVFFFVRDRDGNGRPKDRQRRRARERDGTRVRWETTCEDMCHPQHALSILTTYMTLTSAGTHTVNVHGLSIGKTDMTHTQCDYFLRTRMANQSGHQLLRYLKNKFKCIGKINSQIAFSLFLPRFGSQWNNPCPSGQ